MAQQGQHSKEYLEFAKATDLPPMTNTQVKFAEWLLQPENAAQLEKIGDLESASRLCAVTSKPVNNGSR